MLLREWQENLQGYILHPEKNGEQLYGCLLSGSIDKKIQLNIYANAYALRLIEALLTNYPAIYKLLGDDEFETMAQAYLKHCPSAHASIRWFGDNLAEFLNTQEPYRQVAVFSELAHFEWALRHTIDSANADCVTAEALQSIEPLSWGDLHFVLHPSVSVMALQWNTPQIWKALMEEQEMPERLRQSMAWLIYRRMDLVSNWRSLTELELSAIRCLQTGGSFADVCEVVNDSSQAAGFLRAWVEQGLISFR